MYNVYIHVNGETYMYADDSAIHESEKKKICITCKKYAKVTTKIL